MKYRKLSAKDLNVLLEKLGFRLTHKDSEALGKIREYIQQYYPEGASSVLVSYNSEYNDNTYDVSVQYVAVYDKDQNELLPLKDKAREARSQWSNIFHCNDGGYDGPREPVEDKVWLLNTNALPDLYVLEK